MKRIISLLLTIIPILLSFIELFLKGVTIADIATGFDYISKITTSKSNTLLYKFLGFFPTINSLKELLYSFIVVNLIIFIYYILIKKIINALQENSNKKLIYAIIFLLITISPFYIFTNKFINSNAFHFNWIGIASILLFIVICKNTIIKIKK